VTTASPGDEVPVTGAQPSRRSVLSARFFHAVGQEVGAGVLTPAALARAVVAVLPVDGAGLSTLAGALRVPLGSSGADVALAEELQATLGQGPCLDAAAAQASVVLDQEDLTGRWPLYAYEMAGRTPFRAAASIALRAPGRPVFAALDLYSRSPQLGDVLDLAEIDEHLAAPTAALLTTCLDQLDDVQIPEARPEWYQTAAGRRHDVWVAIGMVMANQPGRARDALSLLRAHAYSLDRSLDDLAGDLVAGRVTTADLDT